MTRYFVKGYGFLSFTKDMGRIIDKNVSETFSGKYSQKLLDHAKHSATDALKTASKKQFKKQQKQMMIWLVIKSLIKLQSSQKLRNRII